MITAHTDQEKRAVCQRCGGERNCQILCNHKQIEQHEDVKSCTNWYILRCMGCNNVFLQTISTNFEDIDCGCEEESVFETIKYWPTHSKRKRPEWLHSEAINTDKGKELADALDELYEALNHNLNMLAGIGLRTCIDIASDILGIDSGNSFNGKLKELMERKFITNSDASRLEILIKVGSAAAHRGWKPTTQDMNIFIDALEHFIDGAIVRPGQIQQIDVLVRNRGIAIPPRPSRK